ncbi:hypothetical protein FNF31_06872 [Cafeteria roenbergensis]|uniref:Uncharacterized protein n=1 Tax=Cafeteria roenbergensis TaxID=33653 RepID=A0A5A8CDY1_CAFRO|nr:hypothetical protein FNF31_06872 [Cafeteria roenbergensis]
MASASASGAAPAPTALPSGFPPGVWERPSPLDGMALDPTWEPGRLALVTARALGFLASSGLLLQLRACAPSSSAGPDEDPSAKEPSGLAGGAAPSLEEQAAEDAIPLPPTVGTASPVAAGGAAPAHDLVDLAAREDTSREAASRSGGSDASRGTWPHAALANEGVSAREARSHALAALTPAALESLWAAAAWGASTVDTDTLSVATLCPLKEMARPPSGIRGVVSAAAFVRSLSSGWPVESLDWEQCLYTAASCVDALVRADGSGSADTLTRAANAVVSALRKAAGDFAASVCEASSGLLARRMGSGNLRRVLLLFGGDRAHTLLSAVSAAATAAPRSALLDGRLALRLSVLAWSSVVPVPQSLLRGVSDEVPGWRVPPCLSGDPATSCARSDLLFIWGLVKGDPTPSAMPAHPRSSKGSSPKPARAAASGGGSGKALSRQLMALVGLSPAEASRAVSGGVSDAVFWKDIASLAPPRRMAELRRLVAAAGGDPAAAAMWQGLVDAGASGSATSLDALLRGLSPARVKSRR